MKEEKTGSWWTGLLYFLFIQSPFETIFGIFDFEPECCQRVANLVGCRPVFIGFCLLADGQQQIHCFAECLVVVASARSCFIFYSENIENEGMEYIL